MKKGLLLESKLHRGKTPSPRILAHRSEEGCYFKYV